MTTKVLIVAGQYHLGDNAGLFQDATFVGYTLALPLTVTLDTENADGVTFQIETHDIETWGSDDWLGHRVRLTVGRESIEVGRLKDPNDQNGRLEVFRFTIARTEIERLLGGQSGSVVLTVEVEKHGANLGLSDDFVLTRIEVTGATARVGAQA